MTDKWWFFIINSVIVLPLWRWFSIWDYKRIQKRREMRFMKVVKVQFPDASQVTFSAIETSDKAALETLARQLGAYEAEKAELEDHPWSS